ncbi:MAG: hypothetical protein M3405_10615 [Acidobacteriota bacterium]|jgi:hypothetical protein|nr:hypothetical protein [Acidobacteriota bacterium]
MQTDVAETIFERVKVLPLEKQKEILNQIENIEKETPPTIWQKIRARAKNIPDEVWDEMPSDGAEQHDHYISGVPKK